MIPSTQWDFVHHLEGTRRCKGEFSTVRRLPCQELHGETQSEVVAALDERNRPQMPSFTYEYLGTAYHRRVEVNASWRTRHLGKIFDSNKLPTSYNRGEHTFIPVENRFFCGTCRYSVYAHDNTRVPYPRGLPGSRDMFDPHCRRKELSPRIHTLSPVHYNLYVHTPYSVESFATCGCRDVHRPNRLFASAIGHSIGMCVTTRLAPPS